MEKTSISRPGRTAGWLWNLRSEWTTWRLAYPSCTGAYPAHRPQAHDRTLPNVLERCTTRNGGPEPAKWATTSRAVLPRRDPPAMTVPCSGPTSQLKGHLYPFDSDRLPPGRPGSQSDAAAARRYGAGAGGREFPDCVGTHGASSSTRTTRRGHHLSRNCPTRRPRLIDSGRRLPPFVGCFRSTPYG
jgi:hypothetical protein